MRGPRANRVRATQTLASLPTYRVRRVGVTSAPIAATDQGYAIAISPSNFSNWADLSAVYDLYRIRRVTVHFVIPRCATPTGTGDVFPTLISAVDYNDSVAPSSAADLLEYTNVRIDQLSEAGRKVSISFVPKLQFTTAGGSDTVMAGPQAWARTSSTDPWYGLKYYLKYYNSGTYNATVVDYYVDADIEFKLAK